MKPTMVAQSPKQVAAGDPRQTVELVDPGASAVKYVASTLWGRVMDSSVSPAVQRRRLRGILRRERLARGLSQEDVAQKLEWSKSKVLRIENGQSSVSTTDLRALLSLYDVRNPAEVEDVVSLGRYARRPGLRERYRDLLPRSFATFLEDEQAATVIRQYETAFVPGVLQTEEYARAVLRAFNPGSSGDRIQSLVRVRMDRARFAAGHEMMHVVLDESALWRRVGGRTGRPGLMIDQLRRLGELSARPEVSIRILPFDVGEHPGMSTGAFTILTFEAPTDDELVYFEQPGGGDVVEGQAAELPRYRDVFDQLTDLTLSSAESADLIGERIEELLGEGRSPPRADP
ncbi:helix-turn-helix domain-containing protein [Actinoplanes sp. HUAS TT8]|uniref:helix-turn-helix domain-containing protein n=1 Tax=Actinoplanes sp. HUAS TT8 TaxID=3447453 RepID=UPI003F52646B